MCLSTCDSLILCRDLRNQKGEDVSDAAVWHPCLTISACECESCRCFLVWAVFQESFYSFLLKRHLERVGLKGIHAVDKADSRKPLHWGITWISDTKFTVWTPNTAQFLQRRKISTLYRLMSSLHSAWLYYSLINPESKTWNCSHIRSWTCAGEKQESCCFIL